MRRFSSITLLFTIALVPLVYSTDIQDSENSLVRLIRAAHAKKSECRYEKEAWEECDLTSGLQRRALKLKAGTKSATPTDSNCEEVKFISRPCKKSCKYLKGTWTECANGARSRIDQLKSPSPGCEASRTVSRKCKSVCRYTKSDWSVCENGLKTKTLTLTEGETADCEQNKVISKQCADPTKQKASKANRPSRGRKTQVKPSEETASS